MHEQKEAIIATLVKEEKVFRQTLRKGIQMLGRLAKRVTGARGYVTADTDPGEMLGVANHDKEVDGEALFTLYDTYGFPVELSVEEAHRQGFRVPDNWREQFDTKMAEQRRRSQTAAKGTFKGGLEGSTMEHRKLHTANHLMYAALKQVVGEHVTQHGSNITTERLRFDFNNDGKVSREQLDEVERLVNTWISWKLPVSYKEYPTKQAFEMGAVGAFGDRYGDTVKVYQMGEGDKRVSFEICGGPHADNTGQLAEGGKRFKIVKEESSSAGIRRVKAVLTDK